MEDQIASMKIESGTPKKTRYIRFKNKKETKIEPKTSGKSIRHTNGEAVGPSRMDCSSVVNNSLEMREKHRGTITMLMTGNPMAMISETSKLKS
jgi:hypothetical protein